VEIERLVRVGRAAGREEVDMNTVPAKAGNARG
jgi:hypothetical protein